MDNHSPAEIQRIYSYLEEKKWLDEPFEISFLAAGEYNENYTISSPSGDFVFRINHGSQLGLSNQTEYEFHVLKALENSGVTPRPIEYDQIPELFPAGVLLMEFLPGRKLRYSDESHLAAQIFAAIHNVSYTGGILIKQPNPIHDIAEESLGLINRFPDHPLQSEKKLLLDYRNSIMKLAEDFDSKFKQGRQCIVNTEVNSGNFLIDGSTAYLVDWEKAVLSTPFQDLGHFLVQTSTRWKDEYVFNKNEKIKFLREYIDNLQSGLSLDEAFENSSIMERTILLRALSWCFMAYYEYNHSERSLKDPITEKKINTYLREIEWLLG